MSFCSLDEHIVRAIQSAHGDPKHGRVSPNLFEGRNISVSRLSILPLRKIIAIFYKSLHHPPRILLTGVGEISVETLHSIGLAYQKPVNITVKIAPTRLNPAHAEIPQKITRGLARKIVKVLKLYDTKGCLLS